MWDEILQQTKLVNENLMRMKSDILHPHPRKGRKNVCFTENVKQHEVRKSLNLLCSYTIVTGFTKTILNGTFCISSLKILN